MNIKKYGSIAFGVLVGIASVYMLATSETARHVDSFIVQWADSSATVRPQMKNHFSSSVVDSLTYITATGSDTTCAFDIYPYMSVYGVLVDTSSSDSTQSILKLYVAVNNQYRRSKLPIFSEYRLARTDTVTGSFVVNITDTDIPVATTGFYIVTGGADNKILSAVSQKLTIGGL